MKFSKIKQYLKNRIVVLYKWQEGKSFLLTVMAGLIGGVVSTLITYSYISYKQTQSDAKKYTLLKSEVTTQCQKFREGVLEYAGLKDSYRKNNIYAIPPFAFNLLNIIEEERQIFIVREGNDFLKVLSEFSKLQNGYNGIQARKYSERSNGRLSWETSIWHDYFQPSIIICKWVGVNLADIEPNAGF